MARGADRSCRPPARRDRRRGRAHAHAKRIRILAAAALVLSGAHARAIGLGDIDVHSPLGQPFHATIPVRLSRGESPPQDLKVDIPGYREHARLGLPKPVGVDDLEPRIATAADGAPSVQLTSRRALNEPALSFLLRLTWAEGRLVREYSVLLDPPALAPSAPTRRTPPALPDSVSRPPPQAAGPEAPAAAAPRSRPPPPAARAAQAPETGERRYGPVRRGENLSRIALDHYPEHRSHLLEMVRVLFRRNRDAFLHDDPNLLMEGTTLVLPGRTQMARAVAEAAESPPRMAGAPEGPPAAAPALAQEYGPVRRNETLYEIAEQLVGDRRAGVHELMQRIYEQNPDAFIDGDMDLLKEGAVLEIPGSAPALARAEPETAPPAPPAREDADERLRQEGEDLKQILTALRAELAQEHERQAELEERFARVEERLQALWILLDDAKHYEEPAGTALEHPSNTPGEGATLAPGGRGPAAAPAEPEPEAEPAPVEIAEATAEPTAAPSQAARSAAQGSAAAPSAAASTEPAPQSEPTAQPVSRSRERTGSGLGGLLTELPKQAAIVLSLWLLIVIALQWRNRNKLAPEEDLFERRRQQAQNAKERLAEVRRRHDSGYHRNESAHRVSHPAQDRRRGMERADGKRLAQEAAVYFSYGEHERAMERIEEAIRLEPDWEGNKVLKLRIQEALGQLEEAEALAREMLSRELNLPEELRAYVEEISRGKHRTA